MGPGEYVLVGANEVSPAISAWRCRTIPFDCAQPPLPRRGDAAPDEGVACQGRAALLHQWTLRNCRSLHADGRQRAQGGADMQKRIAAVVLHPRIGQSFQAIVTGVNNYGTFVPHPRPTCGWKAGARRQGPGMWATR